MIENVREEVTYRSDLLIPACGKTFSDMKFTGKVLYVGVEVIGSMICVSVIGPGNATKNPFFGLNGMASNEQIATKRLSEQLAAEGFIGDFQKREIR
jgi:hypothetical protein